MYYYFWKHKFHDTIVCIYPFRLEDYLFPCPNTKIHQRVYLYLNCGVCNQGIGLTQIIYVMQWRWFTPNVTIIIIIAIRFSQVKCNQVLVLSGVPKHFGSQKQLFLWNKTKLDSFLPTLWYVITGLQRINRF